MLPVSTFPDVIGASQCFGKRRKHFDYGFSVNLGTLWRAGCSFRDVDCGASQSISHLRGDMVFIRYELYLRESSSSEYFILIIPAGIRSVNSSLQSDYSIIPSESVFSHYLDNKLLLNYTRELLFDSEHTSCVRAWFTEEN